MEILDIAQLKQTLKDFATARHWEKFHSPKNLAMALTCESAELLEIFQWLAEQESYAAKFDADKKQHIAQELADILLYATRLADILDIDLVTAIQEKLRLNAKKYPMEK